MEEGIPRPIAKENPAREEVEESELSEQGGMESEGGVMGGSEIDGETAGGSPSTAVGASSPFI
jgi:hypothetical protein